MEQMDYSSIWSDQFYYDREIPKEKWLSSDLTEHMEKIFHQYFLSSRLLYSFPILDTDFLVVEVHLKIMSSRQTRFSDIIHRAMPYPVLLVENYNNEWFKLSFVMAHINSGNSARKVVDKHLESPWVQINEIISFRSFWDDAPFDDYTETNLRHNASYYFTQMSNDANAQYLTLQKYYRAFIAEYEELSLDKSSIFLRLNKISDCFNHCLNEIILDYYNAEEMLDYMPHENLGNDLEQISDKEAFINSVNSFSDMLSSVVEEFELNGWFDIASFERQEDEDDYYDYYEQGTNDPDKFARVIYFEYLEDLSRELTAFQHEMSAADLSKYPMLPVLIEKLSSLFYELSLL